MLPLQKAVLRCIAFRSCSQIQKRWYFRQIHQLSSGILKDQYKYSHLNYALRSSYLTTVSKSRRTLISKANSNYCPLLTCCFTPVRNFSSSNVNFGSNITPISTSLFFPDFPTINAAENAVQFIHGLTGLPWWSTIIVTAFVMRMLLPLPLTAYSMHNAVRLKKLEPEIKNIAFELRKEVSRAVKEFGWDQSKAKREYIKNMKRHVKNLYIRENCHPMKDTATFWIHIPLWLSMSYALRNMASRAVDPNLENHVNCESLTTEGAAWILDLAHIDSTWMLPLLLGIITLGNFELHRSRVSSVTTYQKALTFALRGIALVFIPISAYMPAGLVLYWVSSGFFASIQNLFIVQSKWFSRIIRLPDISTNQETSNHK